MFCWCVLLWFVCFLVFNDCVLMCFLLHRVFYAVLKHLYLFCVLFVVCFVLFVLLFGIKSLLALLASFVSVVTSSQKSDLDYGVFYCFHGTFLKVYVKPTWNQRFSMFLWYVFGHVYLFVPNKQKGMRYAYVCLLFLPPP